MKAAIVVGCSVYDDPRISNLKYAHQDAVRFADRLIQVADLEPENVVRLWDGAEPAFRPTRGNVLRVLTNLSDSLGEPLETLYFFFSGHGIHSPDGSDYLLTSDALRAELEANSLSFDLVLRLLNSANARHVLLFLDACRAEVAGGKVVDTSLAGADVNALCPPGMASFCSCEPGAVSYESDRLGAGLFTAALDEALGEVGRCVTVAELDDYLRDSLPVLSRREVKPIQRAHTRVEPLPVKELEIVSAGVRNRWRSAVAIGQEVRPTRLVEPPVRLPENPILAVDLGTSYSVAALCNEDGDPVLIKSPSGGALVPSRVTFVDQLDYKVGDEAARVDLRDPTRSIRSVKRSIGSDRVFMVDGQALPAELVGSLLVRSLRDNARESAGVDIRKCVTAYPANFNMRQVNDLQRCFELAGLEVVRMVGEPNVAAMAVMADRPDEDHTLLVVDLGGGTFDVAICEIGDGVVEVRAVAGSNELGGIDYDEAILGLARRSFLELHPFVVLTPMHEDKLLHEAERAKRTLSSRASAVLVLSDIETADGLLDLEVEVSRDQVREATAHLNGEIARVVRDVLDWHDGSLPDLVAFTGQGSKIFTVRDSVAEAVRAAGADPEWIEHLQELAVVRGLAAQAGVLTGHSKDVLLLDLSHRGVGIRSPDLIPTGEAPRAPTRSPGVQTGDVGDRFELLHRLTTIPTRPTRVFQVGDEVDELCIEVIERSSRTEEDVTIGLLHLGPGHAGRDLEFRIDVDANSTIGLEVRDRDARWLRSYQLNHHYRYAAREDRANVGRLDDILDGWTVHPMVRLGGLAEAEDLSRASWSLEDLDVEEEYRSLLDSAPTEPAAPIMLARLALILGRPDSTITHAVEALGMIDEWRDQVGSAFWRVVGVKDLVEIAVAVEVGCDALTSMAAGARESAAADMTNVVLEIVPWLVPELEQIRSEATSSQVVRILSKCAQLLEDAGADAQADRVRAVVDTTVQHLGLH